jgi:hypothetical protein
VNPLTASVALATTLTTAVATAAEPVPQNHVRLYNPESGWLTDVPSQSVSMYRSLGYRTPTPEEEAKALAKNVKLNPQTMRNSILCFVALLVGGYFTLHMVGRIFGGSEASPNQE